MLSAFGMGMSVMVFSLRREGRDVMAPGLRFAPSGLRTVSERSEARPTGRRALRGSGPRMRTATQT